MSLLEAQPASQMTPAAFGAWLARRRGREKPYSAETVRKWILAGMPARRGATSFVIEDPEGSHAWWAANRGESVHGGEREGAGRKGGGGKEALPVREDADISPAGGGRESGGAGELIGINRVKYEKLDVETRLRELDYAVKLGQLIRRDEAAEGTSRVLSVVVRELTRLPDRVTDAVAERLRLASEERAALRAALAEESEAVRRWIAEHPLGEDEEENGSTAGTAVAPRKAAAH